MVFISVMKSLLQSLLIVLHFHCTILTEVSHAQMELDQGLFSMDSIILLNENFQNVCV
jgi:hypothetical protein